ncbi:hypothetical protein BDW02DRAFT_580913 [Decorospora gaudefroyi]|uniref:Uncharacterized protein n=1 Tax=Decorospora gaudefroyi TaxID=184978 RepID=A0A6A5K975_9PLEO|nr:hypothetical protein BDW02DRAFT_580913 [Decorospora gaudefroyi]
MKLPTSMLYLLCIVALTFASAMPTEQTGAVAEHVDPAKDCGEGTYQCAILPLIRPHRHAIQRCNRHTWFATAVCNEDEVCVGKPSPHCAPRAPEAPYEPVPEPDDTMSPTPQYCGKCQRYKEVCILVSLSDVIGLRNVASSVAAMITVTLVPAYALLKRVPGSSRTEAVAGPVALVLITARK